MKVTDCMPKKKEDWIAETLKSAGLLAGGHAFGLSIGFISRILIIRYLSQEYFGVYSLGLALVNIFVLISCLGLTQGTTRQISHHKEADNSKVPILMGSSIIIVICSSIASSLVLFFFSEKIATVFFHEPSLTQPLRIFSFAVPLIALFRILISIFRGHSKTKPKLYFKIIKHVVFLLGLTFVVSLALSIDSVVYAYLLSYLASLILLLFYRRYNTTLKFEINLNGKVLKSLLLFSLPLLISSFLWLLLSWTDTMLIGFYLTSREVGLYEGAFSLARNIPLFLGFVGFLHLPSLSTMYGNKELSKMRGIYQTLTRWILYGSIPLFFAFLVFPSFVLKTLFGVEYAAAESILRILSVGFIFHTIVGNNSLALISLGERKVVLTGNLIGFCFNLVLNVFLIPFLGIIGASIASMISYISSNIYESGLLYQKSKINPFSKSYLKSVIIIFANVPLFYLLKRLFKIDFLVFVLLSICYILVCLILLLITDCFGENERIFLSKIEERFGINLEIIKKFL